MKTISITNFGGRLTRYDDGDLNSGFAKFSTSWGYDPFSKPGNLTWMYQAEQLSGGVITDAPLAMKLMNLSSAPAGQLVYAVGQQSRLYEINPTNSGSGSPLLDQPSLISYLNAGSITGGITSIFNGNYGADMDEFAGQIVISGQNYVIRANSAGSIVGFQSVTSGRYHPLINFQGNLYIGNGNNIMRMDSTLTITNGAVLNPPLPNGMYINDIDVSPQGDYMIITASRLYPNLLLPIVNSAIGSPYAVEAFTYYWNGVDEGITAFETQPSFPASALHSFNDKRYTFNSDTFGTALYEGNQKMLTLPNNLAPMPGAVAANGDFITWASPEGIGSVNSSSLTYTDTVHSLYYFGRLDAENPAGLYRVARIDKFAGNNSAFRTPANILVNNFAQNRQFVAGWGKHYICVWDYVDSTEFSTGRIMRFVLPPAANTSPMLGVYETQNQLFSKRISVKQVRVYTEGTAANNGFQLDLIGAGGNILSNGTFTYSYVAGSDETRLQGSMERINFNPRARTTYSLGIRITNTGTVNMTIPKVEVDVEEEGR